VDVSTNDWWYRVWWVGYSGRTHKLEHKVRLWNGHWVDKKGYGLPPAISRNIVKTEKIRRVKELEK
jgi:hypothetical protein